MNLPLQKRELFLHQKESLVRLREEYRMTAANQQVSLNEVSPEALMKAVQAVLDRTAKTLANEPEPQYRTSCPRDTLLDGNYDDAWEEGQENGQLWEAKRIQDLIFEALATA
jgi:hypothetical protein